VEHELSNGSTLTAEILYHRLSYDVVTTHYAAGTSNMKLASTERTKATLFDIPLMMHVRAFPGSEGFRSGIYVGYGATFRTMINISSTHDYLFWDKANDTIPAQPSRRNLVGAVVGVGYRFVDDFRNKVTPQIRYTRWFGRSFDTGITKSPVNQVDLSLGVTF
jgi:hypothetical protein